MKFLTFETIWNNYKYKIEDDFPEVGAYLYCYVSDECICDYLQNSIDECKEFAFNKFGVPIDSWIEKNE